MSLSSQAVIIVNFDFPPNQGIGGRRWAKFAKGLAAKGVRVYVIKADPVSSNKISPWTDETIHPLIEVHSIKRTYPESVSHPGKGWKRKFRYLWELNQLKKKTRGTIYDIAIGWQDVLTRKLTELVESKKVTQIIATGAPFNALYYCALFKKTHPGVKLLVDYRDPWLTAQNYGMPFLSADAKKFEAEKQHAVFQYADVIVSPYEELTNRLFDEAHEVMADKSKFKVLPHFYDDTEVLSASTHASKSPSNKVTFVYGGALYTGTGPMLDEWRDYLLQLQNSGDILSKRLLFKVFTDNQPEAERFKDIPSVQTSPTIGKRIFEELTSADFCIVMAAEHNKNQFTTKFFEYLPLRKPFIYFGPEGDISRFIEEHSLGRRIADFKRDIPVLIDDLDSNRIAFNDKFDISSYSLSAATERLLSLLS